MSDKLPHLGIQMISLACVAWLSAEAPADEHISFAPNPAIRLGDRDASISTSSDGFWSIGSGWDGSWPERWFHGEPMKTETLGRWTRLSGRNATDDGVWAVQDRYRAMDTAIVQCKRRWHYQGEKRSVGISIGLPHTS